MTTQTNRSIFRINNKYQMGIVLLIAAPLFVITMALLMVTCLMNAQVSKLVLNHTYYLIGPCVTQWFYLAVCFIIISLFTFMLLAFKIAHDLVNPFSRIILEIDEIIITGSKRSIAVRPEDELAKEVSDRFNKLINLIP